MRGVLHPFSVVINLRLVNNLSLSLLILLALDKVFLLLDSFKGSNLALVALVVVFPPFDSVGLDQSSVDLVGAVEDRSTVLLNVEDILLVKLEIILCAFVQVA